MKSRLLVAAVGIPLLLVIIFLCPPVVTALAISLLCAIGARELLETTGIVTHRGIVAVSMVVAFLVPVWSYLGGACFRDLETQILVGAIGLFLFVLVLFVLAMADYPNVKFAGVTGAVIAGVVIPLGLSSVLRILMMENGRCYVLVPILIPFIADAGAYFVGCAIGRHKLAPVLSPKKSWEGVFGGLAAGVIGMMLYGLVMQFVLDMPYHYGYAAIYGLLGAVISVIGDLSFSMVKRETGIKDYGTLFRAHGGVLDRFDSMSFAAPLVEILILLLPILG